MRLRIREHWYLLVLLLNVEVCQPRLLASDDTQVRQRTTIEAGLSSLPLSFEENRGQAPADARFVARARGASLILGANAVRLRAARSTVRMDWLRANPDPRITGEERLAARSNYLYGRERQRWVTDVSTFKRVRYANVYPQTDLVFHSDGQRALEYDWIIRPGGRPSVIRMRFSGVQRQRIDRNGKLVLRTRTSEITQAKPSIYQVVGGQRQSVDGRYLLHDNNEVTFEIGRYDHAIDLVIDPVLAYAALVGGTASSGTPPITLDQGNAIAVDSSGNAYVTGTTSSTDFPLANAIQTTTSGVFVLKLDPTGSTLIYSTFIGGLGRVGGAESGNGNTSGIAVDAAGNAVIVGTTSGSLPTANAFQSAYGGGDSSSTTLLADAFVTKLNPAGNDLVFSTYLGGSRGDGASSVAMDSGGNIYVSGTTNSKDFPVTQGVFQPTLPTPNGPCANRVCTDAFVSKFSPQGELLYSTYLGGSQSNTWAAGIAVDGAGNAYVSGKTSAADFPITSGAYQTSCSGCGTFFRVFVSKLNPSASTLAYSTFLGGSATADDIGTAIAVDASGSAYVTGLAQSKDFPGTTGSYQQVNVPNSAFVTKLNPQGNALAYSTFLEAGFGYGIAVDSQGNATVVGGAGLGFPLQNAIQLQNGGCSVANCAPEYQVDAFITRLNSQGSALIYSTFFGGDRNDSAYGVALDSSGNAYVTGQWGSGWAEYTAGIGLVQKRALGGAFVVKISPSGSAPQIQARSVVNGASFLSPAPMEALATVFGTGLSQVTGIVQASTIPLPTQLAGVSVTVGGAAAPIIAVANVNGQEQINFQVPVFTYGPDAKSTGLSVNNNGAVSASVVVPDSQAPGIFTTNGISGAIVGSSRVDLQACKLEYSIVSPK